VLELDSAYCIIVVNYGGCVRVVNYLLVLVEISERSV